MPKHIHADLISEYARLSHITDKPWEYFEWWNFHKNKWESLSREELVGFHSDYKYRLKPRTIKIGEIEFPEPVRDPSAFNNKEEMEYFMPSIKHGRPDYLISFWNWVEIDSDRLNSEIIHLDKESAMLHAKALISLTSK